MIDARDFEHQRHGLHPFIFIAAFAERYVRLRRDVAVASRINDDFRQNGFAAGLAFKNDAADRRAVHDDIRAERMRADDNSCLIQLVEQH